MHNERVHFAHRNAQSLQLGVIVSTHEEFTFGDLLRSYRKRHNISRQELGNLLGGIHLNTIANWENGGRPRHREDILGLEMELRLSPEEMDLLLYKANFELEYNTNIASFSRSDHSSSRPHQKVGKGKIYGYLRMDCGKDEFKTVAVQESKIIIGRNPDCTLLVPEKFERASRVHAAIYPLHGNVYVEDLGSSNGTYIDGRKVDNPSSLHFGQHVLLGAGVPFKDVCVLEFLQLPSSTK
jgi:transcriptional regulator with XRE-family HTH domain